MFDLIPLLLILLSFLIIIIIIVRKFPALASLDIETIQTEKEKKFKEQIISNRLKRNLSEWKKMFLKFIIPINKSIISLFNWIIKKLYELKEKYKSEEKIIPKEEIKDNVESLFEKVDDFIRKDMLDEAEKKVIEIISLESKNIKAFKQLGQLYIEKKSYDEAKETFLHVIKLLDIEEENYNMNKETFKEVERDMSAKFLDFNIERSEAYYELSLISEITDELEEAVKYIKKSLNIDPNNPRYLDTLIELSIMKKDKNIAFKALERLEEVNPENNKIGELRERIVNLK